MSSDWIPTSERLPPQGVVVATKIDDDKGVRNVQAMKRLNNLWLFPDGSGYVYYTPTHWREVDPPQAALPLDVILHCPKCHAQHVDAPEPESGWTNPPHKSHLCHACGAIWRPADVPTNGVATIKTRGERDTV